MTQIDLFVSWPHYYIPHHCVIRPESVSTKLRVVFNASFLSSLQLSLSDSIMVGPTIQNTLLITLLCFKYHQQGLTADSVKMYRQVLVHSEDRNIQLILWRDNPLEFLKTYSLHAVQHQRHTSLYVVYILLLSGILICIESFIFSILNYLYYINSLGVLVSSQIKAKKKRHGVAKEEKKRKFKFNVAESSFYFFANCRHLGLSCHITPL